MGTTHYRTTRYGVSQHYRTPVGNTQFLATYDRNLWQSTDFGEDNQDAMTLEMTQHLDQQTLQIISNITRNNRSRSNESTSLNNVAARHSYRPDPTLSVESLASQSKASYHLSQGESDMRYRQLSSFAFWRPTGKPLTVTGSARIFGQKTSSSGASSSRTRSANANLGGTYELTRRTRMSGSLNVSKIDSNGAQAVTSNQSAGLTYQSDSINLGNFRYSGYASGSLANRIDPTNSGQHFSLQFGHSLSRNMGLGGGTLGFNLNQTIASDMDSRHPSVLHLSHSGSLSWSHAQGRKNTFFRLSASDSRAVSGAGGYYQLLNLQVSRDESMGRNVSWAGNLTIQAARQRTISTPTTTTTTSNANLSYHHRRAFGVPRLRFASELRVYGDAPVPVLASPDQQETRSWENRLDYSIGRLQLRLSARISEVNNKQYSLLMFTLNRQLGGR